jgi:CubicO group peptidase (beta-lactamase class C family)
MNTFYKKLILRGIILQLLMLQWPLSSSGRPCTEDFLDGLFKSQVNEHNIAGLTFSLYSGDTLEMTRNWGYSHVENNRMVDESTGFMIGSVSKLFVWVSVMQLVEQGKLDLNKPVNSYLSDFRLPDNYQPVTMKHLMTHTPGFEDGMHIFAKRYESLPELKTYLDENLPKQIYEPGTTPAYSNYGVALAAFVIEQITGGNFNDYVEKNIFEPLGMQNTTFRQPASFAISDAKSKGYIFSDGRFTSPFDEYVLPAPAGSAVSTASDMIRFMKAMVSEDENAAQGILKPETIDQMLSLLDTPHAQSDGMGYGFVRLKYHGKEIFWHTGGTYFFQTAFVLIPAMKTGIFISTNTSGNNFNAFNQSLLIVDFLNGNLQDTEGGKRVNGMNHFAGTYTSSRMIKSNYLKVFNNFSNVRISGGKEGLLLHQQGREPELFRPYDQDVFASEYKKLIFERNEKGVIKKLHLSNFPVVVFEKVGFRESPVFNIVLLVVVLLIALRNIINPVVRLIKGDKRSRQIFRWFLLFSGGFIYLFFILFLFTFSGVEDVVFEKPAALRIILLIPLTSLVLFLAALFFWIKAGIWSTQPIPYTLSQFAGFLVLVIFYLQMHYWNFFDFMV